MGAWLLNTRRSLDGSGLAAAAVDRTLSYVEWPLILVSIGINLSMLYRNCSEMGSKAPEVRANGARVIAGYLRLAAAGHLAGAGQRRSQPRRTRK